MPTTTPLIPAQAGIYGRFVWIPAFRRYDAPALPGDAHAGFAAYARDVVAESDVELGEHGGAGGEVEEVYARRDLASHIVELVVETERGAARNERSAVGVAGEIAPHAADHERLHDRAGPGLHRRARAQAEPAPDIGVVVEGDTIAADAEPVEIGPSDAMVVSGSMTLI